MYLEKINQSNKDKLVDDVMELPKTYIKPNSYIREIAEKMLKRGGKFELVLEDDYSLQGYLTHTDLVEVVYHSIWGEESQKDQAKDGLQDYNAAKLEQA